MPFALDHHDRVLGVIPAAYVPMRRVLPLALFLLLISVEAFPFSAEVVGVLEGSSIEVVRMGKAQRIHLHGLDCPEKDQPYGDEVKPALSALVFAMEVTVEPRGKDKSGRILAEVLLADGTNVNHTLVKEGRCWWSRKFAPNNAELERLELEAREAKVGLWEDPEPIPPVGISEDQAETIPQYNQSLSYAMGYGTQSVDASLSASRQGFLFGTILVFIMNFAVIVLAGARGIPEWTEYLALAGILAHVILIQRREQALYTSRRWRFWYALFIAGFACNLMTRHLWMQGHDGIVDPIQLRGQLLVGGFLLFYVMVSPVMLGLIIRNQKS